VSDLPRSRSASSETREHAEGEEDPKDPQAPSEDLNKLPIRMIGRVSSGGRRG
jgi:hypothetical protein